MAKIDHLKKLISLKNQVDSMDRFKGQAALIHNIEDKISFLRRHKVEDSLKELLVQDVENKIKNKGR